MENQSDIRLKLAFALASGAFESPQWQSFLELLRVVAGADYATLAFRPPGRPYEEMLILVSGAPPSVSLDKVYRENFYPLPPPFNEALVEGRAYGRDEWLEMLDAPSREATEKYLALSGVSDICEMRVREPSGINAWLCVTRIGGGLSGKPGQLLMSIAPALRGALQNFIALERERFKTSMSNDAARRLYFSWLALDRTGRVIDSDEQGAAVLASTDVIGISANGSLTARSRELDIKIRAGIESIMSATRPRPVAISLSNDPWLDMLLLPARQTSISARMKPDVIAYIHGDSWRVAGRTAQLAELFALTAREAELALAFCRGLTIAEAATELGLTIATARNYSKAIYAKTGARSMADLIRLIMRSILALSPV